MCVCETRNKYSQFLLSGHQDTEAIDTETLIVVLLKEILDQSPNGEEALHTLGEKLCEKLRAVQETHIVSFQDYVGMSVKQFLINKACYFQMTNRGNNIMVSNVICEPFDDASLPVDQETRSNDAKAMFGEDPACGSQSVEWEEVLSKKKKQTKRRKQKEKATSNQEQAMPAQGDPFITNHLKKPPGTTLIFRPSGYRRDQAIDFTTDVVSLWNTPNRNRSYIILGVQTRSSLPHQVVGLKSAASAEFYYALFLRQLFQSVPRFNYRETLYHGKRVGIITVEKSTESGFPSIVQSDDKSPKLKKNQLWVRNGARNTTVESSDVAQIGQIFSWFQKTPAQQRAGDSTVPQNRFATLVSAQPPAPETPETAGPKELSKTSDSAPVLQHGTVETSELMEALTHFKRGHFVLLCGSLLNTCINLEALSHAPFIAVYDFDVKGRETGLLAYLEGSLKKKRSLVLFTWMDPHTGITERGTQWWSLRGRSDVPDSNLSEMTLPKWTKRVRDKMEKLCIELQRFNEDYSNLTLIVLWPAQEVEIACMQKFLSKLQEYIQSTVVLWFTDQETQDSDAREVKNIQADFEDSVKIFHHSLEDFCTELSVSFSRVSPGTFEHRLPALDGTTVVVTPEEAAWLQQDCEVLYIDNPYTQTDLTAEILKAEADRFFRGGSINWFIRYDTGSNCFDVERSISKPIMKHIQTAYIEGGRSGTVRLYHAPGSGGSTMSQRILFDLHEIAPCVHIKQRSGSSTEELADRLYFLCDRTRMPLVVLLDGEDEQKLKQLLTQVRRNTIVALYVRRFPYAIDESRQCNESESKFYLDGFVTKQESRNLVLQFTTRCDGIKKKLNGLKKLDMQVQKEQQKHQMFEYGLTVYDSEFQGVKAYVRGYLQIEQNKGIGLWPWQKCLGYLALVYHYGQSSLPCKFIGSLMGQSDTLTIEELPYQVKMLVVPDVNEGKSHHVRIMHFVIATEILEQILSSSSERHYSGKEKLSREAKCNLKDFCIDFLSQIVKDDTKSSLTGQTVMYILTKTFIFRDYTDVIDIETQTRKAHPQFSQLMQDLDSHPPFHGRHEVLMKLCETFPDNPNFKAHLGRFFTLCRPEEEEEAEKNFKEAIKLGTERDSRKSPVPDECYDLDLMHIYHMYGYFFQRRISRKTSRAEVAMCGGDSGALQRKMDEVIFDAEQACQNFALCRHHSPPANKEAYQYFNEIDVRLQTCRFIRNSFPGGIQAVLQSWQHFGTCYRFVKNSISEVEDLIMECYNYILMENISDLQLRVRLFNSLFRGCVTELQAVGEEDQVALLRLSITTKKLQIDRADTVVSVESQQMSSAEIENIVSILESIFEYERVNRDLVKSKLELDYRDWILAIRNPNFRPVNFVSSSAWNFCFSIHCNQCMLSECIEKVQEIPCSVFC